MTGIDVLPSADQMTMVDAVARAVGDLFPITRLDHGRKPVVVTQSDWNQIAELGWIGMALPEEAGGVGYDLTDAVLAHRQFARHFVTPSLLASTVASKLAVASADGLAQQICSGQIRAAFVMPCAWERPEGPHYVLDPHDAELFVTLDAQGARFVSVDLAAASPVEPMDSTVSIVRAPSAVPAGEPDVAAGLWARALIASELAGLAQAASEMAAAYAKIRQQFGKPIGSFQAVAHACADCAMRAEAAVAQSNFATIAIRDDHPDAAFQAGAAVLVAADAAFRNATSNIQVHGGMGFAMESDAHLYLKRAVLLRALGRASPANRTEGGSGLRAE